MLTYDINKRGNQPIYDFLYKCIRSDIQSGVIKAGEKMPSKRKLAEHLNISINTVMNTYEQLLSEGYIVSKERCGYFAEELSDYIKRPPEKEIPDTDPQKEDEFLADFKANRPSSTLFPASVWAKYMREAISAGNKSLMDVIPYNGLYELRCAIADYLKRSRGITVSHEQIIIGAGTEYLYGRLLQLFGHESILAIEDPGYKKFANIAQMYGNTWRYVPIDSHGLIIDELEESGADIIHLSPANHFPTGTIMPIGRRIQLFEWANKVKKRFIIEDDYDSEFRYSGKFIPPLYSDDVMGKVIYMNTFSKTLVPSLRISYMVLPPKLLKRYVETMSFYSCTVSSYEQYALAGFINDGHLERHISRLKKYYSHQRVKIIKAIQQSELSRISEILEKNAGTHFLLRVDTILSEEEIVAAGKKKNINFSMLSDYTYSNKIEEQPTLVINYAGINSDDESIKNIVDTLISIFPETQQYKEQKLT